MAHENAVYILTEEYNGVLQSIRNNEDDGAHAREEAQKWDTERAKFQTEADELLAAIKLLEDAK